MASQVDERERARESGIKREGEGERGRERLVIVPTMLDCAHCSVILLYISFACSAFRIIKDRIVVYRRVRPIYNLPESIIIRKMFNDDEDENGHWTFIHSLSYRHLSSFTEI